MKRNLIADNSTKIVLGHPLSGALYAYFDKELNDGHHVKSSTHHGYYKTLYGKHFESYIDIALTLSLIYDNIILTPADNPVPDYDKYEDEGEYYNPDFGLFFTWNDGANLVTAEHEEIKLALSDKEILRLLNGIPKKAHEQIIRDVFVEVEMANQFDATLFTLGRRQAIAKRIIEIAYKPNPQFSDPKIKIVSNYIDITGLLFQPMEIQSFYYLKTEKDLKQYASSFLKVLESFSPDNPKDIKKRCCN